MLGHARVWQFQSSTSVDRQRPEKTNRNETFTTNFGDTFSVINGINQRNFCFVLVRFISCFTLVLFKVKSRGWLIPISHCGWNRFNFRCANRTHITPHMLALACAHTHSTHPSTVITAHTHTSHLTLYHGLDLIYILSFVCAPDKFSLHCLRSPKWTSIGSRFSHNSLYFYFNSALSSYFHRIESCQLRKA